MMKIAIITICCALLLSASAFSSNLAQAIFDYKVGNFSSAANKFYLASKEESTKQNRLTSLLFLANSLYKLKLYLPSQHYLMQILNEGADYKYFDAVLKKAVFLSSKLGDYYDISDAVLTLKIYKFPTGAADALNYKLAVYLLGEKKYDEALDLFSKIGDPSVYFRRAQYITGILEYRRNNYRKAIEIFEKLVNLYGFGKDKELEDETFLALGRVFYALGEFQKSILCYEQLPKNSRGWADSLYELSWAYFMTDNYNKALGVIYSLNSPYLSGRYFHELKIVEAIIYYNLCIYAKSKESLESFHKTYDSITNSVKKITEEYRDSQVMAEMILSDDFEMQVGAIIANDLLRDDRFMDLSRLNKYIKEEHALYKRLAASLHGLGSDFGDEVEKIFDGYNAKIKGRIGRVGVEYFKDAYEDMVSFNTQANLIQFEVVSSEKNVLTGKSVESDKNADLEKAMIGYEEETKNKIKKSSRYYFWKVKQEYWVDELGDYVFNYKSQCK